MNRYIILALCLTASIVNSQNCSSKLTGKIDDFHDGTAIEAATLYIESLNRYVTSDTEGNYEFDNLCDGLYKIVVAHVACDNKTVNVTVKGTTVYNVSLEHHIEELKEVKVAGQSSLKETRTSQESVIKTEQLEDFSSQSLGDAMQLVSGVSTLNTGNTIVKPVINGLHSSRIIVLNNGVRLQDQEWGIEHAPNIDINSVGSISVIKGSGALAFGGDAIGGVVVLNPERIRKIDTLYGKTIMSAQSNGKGYTITSSLTKNYQKGWFVSGQGTLKRYGDFESRDYVLSNTGLNSRGFTINGGFKTFEKGFNVYYSYINNEIAILRASHIGNIEDLVNAINSDKPSVVNDFTYDIDSPRQDVTHHLLKAEFYKRFKKVGRLEVQYDFQNNSRFEYDVRVGNDRDKPAVDLNLQTQSIKTSLKIDSNLGNTYEIGIAGSYQNNFANPETGVRRLIPDYEKYDFGSYIITDFRLNDAIFLDFGLRYDFNRYDAKKFYQTSRWEERGYDEDFSDLVINDLGTQLLTNPVFNYYNISGSAGLLYKLDDKNSFIFNYSLSNRAPNPSELFSDGLHHSAARIELGDLRIKQEVSNRFGATYQYQSESITMTIEGFYNRVKDFIYIEPEGTEQTIRGAFPVWSYKQTNATLYGLDVMISYMISEQFNANNKTSIIKGRDLTLERPLIDIPAFKTVNSIGYQNKKWLGLHTELESELVFRQNEFPDNNFEVFVPTTNETVLVDVSTPPPAYHLLNFKSDITLELSQKTNLNVGLSIQNILNVSYRDYLNRLRYFADDLGRNFMLQLKLNY